MGAFGWTPPKGNPHGADADKEYPLVLTQGKVVTQWQQTMTNFAASLAQFSRGRYVLVHRTRPSLLASPTAIQCASRPPPVP